MTKNSSDFPAYVCFKKPNDNELVQRMMISPSLEEISNCNKNVRDDKRTSEEESGASKSRISPSERASNGEVHPTLELSSLMKRFKKAISSYHVLASASLSIVPVMKAIYINSEMLPQAQKLMEQVEIDDDYITYGVGIGLLPLLSRHSDRLDEMSEASSVLPGSILLSLVATFDSLIVDIIKFMLKSRKDIIEGSGKTFTAS